MEYDDIIVITKGKNAGKNAKYKSTLQTQLGTMYAAELLSGGNVMLSVDQFKLP